MIQKFKYFESFLFESKTSKVVDLLNTFLRCYDENFFTDAKSFKIIKEHKMWRNLKETSEIGKTKSCDAKYSAEIQINDDTYKLSIDFIIKYNGQKEKDSPEPIERIATVLENIENKHVKIESSTVNYDGVPNDAINKITKKLLFKILSDDYDMLSSEIYNLQQT